MNRRTALAAIALLPAVASGAISNGTSTNGNKLYVADLFQPVNQDDFDFPKTPREIACFLANWELSATRNNRMRGHVCCIQWSKDAAAFIGAGGPEDWQTDRAARVLAMFCRIDEAGNTVSDWQMAAYRTPCRRAWCLVIDGVLTDDCRAEFKRPLWTY